MVITTAPRATNAKGQFILPDLPSGMSPELASAIEDYRLGFAAMDEDGQSQWDDAARRVHAFEPESLADLAAKMIIAIHYRDPEWDGHRLAIADPTAPLDRLAVEMELDCLDWVLARVPNTTGQQTEWDAAEAAYAKAEANLETLTGSYSDQEVDRLADIRSDAIDAILRLPATTITQALRKIELAMFDNNMVIAGIDFPALLSEARQLAAGPLALSRNPVRQCEDRLTAPVSN